MTGGLKDLILSGTTSSTTTPSATVTSTHKAKGLIYAIEVDIDAFNSTADTTISITGRPLGADYTVLTLTNSNTSATYFPRPIGHTNAGANLASNIGIVMAPLDGAVKVAVVQAGASKAFKVRIIYYEP